METLISFHEITNGEPKDPVVEDRGTGSWDPEFFFVTFLDGSTYLPISDHSSVYYISSFSYSHILTCQVGHVIIYQPFYWKLLGSYFGAFGHQ